jgi:hypothetical protein
MPIGQLTTGGGGGGGGGGGMTVVPGAIAKQPITKGFAVAVLPTGYVPCSAIFHALRFTGFAMTTVATDATVALTAGRGSVITPCVENGEPLIPEKQVFLSLTPGYVTQTAPPVGDYINGEAVVLVPLGFAISATQMVLITDARFGG